MIRWDKKIKLVDKRGFDVTNKLSVIMGIFYLNWFVQVECVNGEPLTTRVLKSNVERGTVGGRLLSG